MKAFGTLDKQAEALFLKDLMTLGKTATKEEYKKALSLLSEKRSVRNDIDFSKLKGVIVFRKGSKNSSIIKISNHQINMFKEEYSKMLYFKLNYNFQAIENILKAYEEDERIESTMQLLNT